MFSFFFFFFFLSLFYGRHFCGKKVVKAKFQHISFNGVKNFLPRTFDNQRKVRNIPTLTLNCLHGRTSSSLSSPATTHSGVVHSSMSSWRPSLFVMVVRREGRTPLQQKCEQIISPINIFLKKSFLLLLLPFWSLPALAPLASATAAATAQRSASFSTRRDMVT